MIVELGVELGCSGDSRRKEEKRADKCCQWSWQYQEGGGLFNLESVGKIFPLAALAAVIAQWMREVPSWTYCFLRKLGASEANEVLLPSSQNKSVLTPQGLGQDQRLEQGDVLGRTLKWSVLSCSKWWLEGRKHTHLYQFMTSECVLNTVSFSTLLHRHGIDPEYRLANILLIRFIPDLSAGIWYCTW